ncbi:MAG: AraC family transcriptional regulator, partial [Nitrospinota bacterium]
MEKLVKLLTQLTVNEEFNSELLPEVNVFRCEKRLMRAPNMLDPCIIVIAQGSKIAYLGDEKFPFNAEKYLVLSQPIPFECETMATPRNPLLGVSICVQREILYELVSKTERKQVEGGKNLIEKYRGMGSTNLDKNMKLSVERLLACLLNPDETIILGPSLLREVIYRALCGPYGPALFDLVGHNTNFERISRALKQIHGNLASPLSVDLLARKANMSVSSFHHAFREITLETPIQYIKKVRLNKAKELIVQKKLPVNEIAVQVGYSST